MLVRTSSSRAVRWPSLLAPALSLMVNGCRVVVAVNCSVRVSSSWTGRFSFRAASATRSSVRTSCLPPKPPPTRPATTCTRSSVQPEHPAQGAPDQERNLAGGTDLEPAFGINGGDGRVGFKGHVLDALGPVGLFVDEVCGCETHPPRFPVRNAAQPPRCGPAGRSARWRRPCRRAPAGRRDAGHPAA